MHVKSHNLTISDAVAIIEHGGESLFTNIGNDIGRYLPNVNTELATIAERRMADATRHAQECLVFAILSPQMRIALNTTMVRRFFDSVDNGKRFATCDDLYQTIAVGIGSNAVGPNVNRLYQSLDAIAALTPDDMTKDGLLALRKARVIMGIGQKTASMAVALFNEHASVFTLDVHMLRWMCETCLGFTAGQHTIDDKAYQALEPWIVGWAKRYFPKESPFAVQWAIWDVRQGQHETHLPIFGLE